MPNNPPFASARPRLPVTVLNGFAGAGKTSVLNHLLRHRAAQPTAVIVSDGGRDEGPAGAATVARTEEKVIRLAVGSGCHALRADLLLEAGRLVREERFGYLLIENPGRAELAPVARTFLLGHAAAGLDLPRRTRLDTLATVVDAGCFWRDFHAPAAAPPADPPGPWEEPQETAPRCAAEVLAEQVENANVLVLNKTDQARPEELNRLRALLAHLNPRARLVEATFGQVNPADLLDTGLCDCAAAPAAPAAPAAAAHGISTWRFRDERPFHPARLWEFVREGWPAAVLRSQGLFWLAARPEEVLRWDQAGPSRRAATAGTWWAAVPVAERGRDPAFRRDEPALRARWHPQFQDRVNTLRFIGQDLDQARLRADLAGCLCTPLEIGRWRRGSLFDDPWPRD